MTSFVPSVAGADLSAKLVSAKENYVECMRALPAKVRWGLGTESARGKRDWGRGEQKKARECLEQKRTKEDVEDTIGLAGDLKGLYGPVSVVIPAKEPVSEVVAAPFRVRNLRRLKPAATKMLRLVSSETASKAGILRPKDAKTGDASSVVPEKMEAEAETLAEILVDTTRALNENYRMGRVALWHNFLIKIGAREGGYCYQWAEELFKALPQEKLTYFERHWGVHAKAHVTENNAVIITRRGRPVSEGFVYDPWRGKGKPFWRAVSKDNQTWSELYDEDQILAGQM